MPFTAIQIVNLAGAKLGSFGEQVSASGQISSLADTDAISVQCNAHYSKAIQQVIIDMAILEAPIRQTVKNAELDNELTVNDVVISDITVGAAPTYTVTVTTDEVHGLTTGDTIVLKGIDGDDNISSLNGKTRIAKVTSTLIFTLNEYAAWLTTTPYVIGDLVTNGGSYYRCLIAHTAGTFATDLAALKWVLTSGASAYGTTGDADWVYTEDSGVVSTAPALGPYSYAFDLPSDCLAVVRVTDESFGTDETTRRDYRFDMIRNKDNTGDLILTNELTNADGDGIYIEYAIDCTSGLLESDNTPFGVHVVDAIATYLASDLAPVVGRNTDVALAMLTKYKNQALPDAVAANQSQGNRSAVARTNLRGGRKANLPTGF